MLKPLQENRTNMAYVRTIFDTLTLKFQSLECRTGWTAKTVYDVHFETVIVKLQEKSSYDTSIEEENSGYHLLLTNESNTNMDASSSFAKKAVKKDNGSIWKRFWVHEHLFHFSRPTFWKDYFLKQDGH